MIGQRISGRYQIIEPIGGGGMANVYKAHDIILDRTVAVKVLQPHFSEDEQFIRRFRREAQAATSLAHPNVVSIYDVGEEGKTYYIVMEYVEGQTLKELIQEKGPLPVEEAIDYMEQMLSAIAHAHANHLIHRDLKPHNILIRHDGVLKVTDFGIARAISSATITHTNSIMGSVHYLSPEQARGGHVTYRSDIYSLGIVLYEMVTGILPFSGDTAVSIAIKHLQNDVPSAKEKIPTLPQSVENIIRKATCKDPLQRYESVQEMEGDIATALDPARYNEAPFVPKNDDDEETKAIPIIRDLPDYDDVEKTIEASPQELEEEKKPVKEKKKKKGKAKKWLMIVAIAFIVLFGAMVAAVAILPNVFKIDEVEVPEVVELSFEEAEEKLHSLNLNVKREEVEDEEIPVDHVVRQNPSAGSMVKENATVTLFVSTGTDEIELDDYVGMSIERVEKLLKDMDFKVEITTKETNDEKPGIVLEQRPEEGSLVLPEETTVYLTVSAESRIRLNNLIGDTEEEVRSYFQKVGLVGRFHEEPSNSIPRGQVIRQTPEPYTILQDGDEVSIVISSGRAPETPEKPERPSAEQKPEKPSEPEEEPSRVERVPQIVHVSDEDEEAGKTYDIVIIYRDVETEGEEETFIEETIGKTTEYVIPLRVSPSQAGSYDVYVNGEKMKSSNKYKY